MLLDAGGGDGYDVRTDRLIEIGQCSDDLGSRLVKLSQASAEESSAAVRAHRGWAAASVLERLRATCEHNVEGFGRWVDDMGDRLSAAAREYDKTEEWSMRKLRGIGV